MSKFCPSCGGEISDKVKFCPSCGADSDSFSVKKNEKSIAEETKKDIEDTKIGNKKIEKKYSISRIVMYGIIGVLIILLLLVALSIIFSTYFNGMNENIQRSPNITSAPSIVTTAQMVVTPTQTEVTPTEITTTTGCSDGYILGNDNICHQACGNTYCTGNSVCFNGQCKGCDTGYILGNDNICHQACGDTYCTGNTVCLDGKCL